MNYTILNCLHWLHVDANILKMMPRKTEEKKIVLVRVDKALNSVWECSCRVMCELLLSGLVHTYENNLFSFIFLSIVSWIFCASCHPCGCYFDKYSLMAVVPFIRIIRHATKQKWFRNGLRSTATSLRCWLGRQFSQISIQPSICEMCWTKSHPWRPHLATYRS